MLVELMVDDGSSDSITTDIVLIWSCEYVAASVLVR